MQLGLVTVKKWLVQLSEDNSKVGTLREKNRSSFMFKEMSSRLSEERRVLEIIILIWKWQLCSVVFDKNKTSAQNY